MKKKFLLAVLPAVLVLSSCSIGPKERKDLMIEDTLAHEEIFGALPAVEQQEAQPVALTPRKLGENESFKPIIGFQHKDNHDGTYSVRFYAAVEGDIKTAMWTRSVHDLAGATTYGKTRDTRDVSTLYPALNNNGNPAFASSEKAIEEDAYPFTYYAVYCLLNIPAENHTNYFVDAALTVSKEGGSPKTSDIGSLNVVDPNQHIKFAVGQEDKYVATINGKLRDSDSLDGNNLTLYSVELAKDDVVAVYKAVVDSVGFVYSLSIDEDTAMGRESPDFTFGGDKKLTVDYKGTFNIFYNTDCDFYFERKVYFQGPTGWGTDKGAMIQLKDNGYPEKAMSSTETAGLFVIFVDNTNHEDVQFFQESWGTKSDWTGYRGHSITEGKDLFTLSTWDNVGTNGSWSVYGD